MLPGGGDRYIEKMNEWIYRFQSLDQLDRHIASRQSVKPYGARVYL